MVKFNRPKRSMFTTQVPQFLNIPLNYLIGCFFHLFFLRLFHSDCLLELHRILLLPLFSASLNSSVLFSPSTLFIFRSLSPNAFIINLCSLHCFLCLCLNLCLSVCLSVYQSLTIKSLFCNLHTSQMNLL